MQGLLLAIVEGHPNTDNHFSRLHRTQPMSTQPVPSLTMAATGRKRKQQPHEENLSEFSPRSASVAHRHRCATDASCMYDVILVGVVEDLVAQCDL